MLSRSRSKFVSRPSLEINPADFKDRDGPTVLAAQQGTFTPIQQLFNDCGFPWQDSYQQQLDDFDIPFFRWLKKLDTPPCLVFKVGLARVSLSPFFDTSTRDLPPAYFSGNIVPKYEHPLDNLKFAQDQFAERLSSAKIAIKASNTIGCGWTSGPSNLDLMIFPYELSFEPEKTTRRLYYRKRSRRRCSIATYTGFRQKLSSQELEWLHNSQRIIERPNQMKVSNFREIWSQTPIQAQRFLREPPLTDIPVYEAINISNDGKALIECGHELHIIPTDRITHFAIHTLRPARAGSETWLTLLAVYRHIETTNAEGSIDLFCEKVQSNFMDLAQLLAKTLGKKIIHLKPEYNC